MKPRINREQIQSDPSLIWNTFIEIIGHDTDDLEPSQRSAGLVFRYESEVQNGGHLQYFENAGFERPPHETYLALQSLGATCQARVYLEAAKLFFGSERMHPSTPEEYSELANEGEFDDLDQRFYECDPSLIQLLEAHLKLYQSDFIEIVL